MKLITKVEIENFRSIKKCKIEDIQEFNSLFGLNNSGKSNILRALNLFFNNETDKGHFLDFDSDFHQSKSKNKKTIKITVTFQLPQNFKFKKTLQAVEKFILKRKTNREITIKKIFVKGDWILDKIYLNKKPVAEKDLKKIDLFLNLINFRYIPNRILPVEILEREGFALQKAIARKLNKQRTGKKRIKKATEALSQAISKTSQALIEPISKELKKLSQNNTTVELITPSLVEDLISTSGYFLNTGNVKVRDIYQGSGIQSFLMFHTLHLIDRDYAQQFGWKQATIWAVEEPESSLHFDLEAQLAMFLFETVIKKDSRLQFFCTTHSMMFVQHTSKYVLVEKPSTETNCRMVESTDIYKETSESGISQHTHPLLFLPRQNILLCEGQTDVVFTKKIFELLNLDKTRLHITCLSKLRNKDDRGGVDTIKKYIEENKEMIDTRYRAHQTKVIILLDWEADIDKKFKAVKNIAGVSVIQWPEEKINAKTKKLKGIESLYPERFFKESMQEDQFKDILSKDGNGNYNYSGGINKQAIPKLKNELSQKIDNELLKKDIKHLKEFIESEIMIYKG